MIALLQRVLEARVEVEGAVVGEIGRGLLVFLGVARGDAEEDLAWLSGKIARLRIFPGEDGKLDRDVIGVGGAVLCVSQFTLLADCQKGRRPGFGDAEEPQRARELWEGFFERLEGLGLPVERGRFGADMKVALVNDGPFTIRLDSRG